jgi:hypothetical protein
MEYKMRVLIYSATFASNNSRLGIVQQDTIINANRSSNKYLLLLPDFNKI